MELLNVVSILLRALPVATQSKRGLAFNNPPQYIQNWSGVNWAYNWDSVLPDDFPSSMEYVPMLWSDASTHTSTWLNNTSNALARGSGHLLSFNEPDGCGYGQACMSPSQAANAYRLHMMPFAERASLGAPAVSNGPDGLNWLQEFLALCVGCKVDFIPVHWYDTATNFEYFYGYMQNVRDTFNAQIWITEVRIYPSHVKPSLIIEHT